MLHPVKLAGGFVALALLSGTVVDAAKNKSDKERIAQLEEQVTQLSAQVTHMHDEDIANLFQRTEDLRGWLEQLHQGSTGDQKAMLRGTK